MLTTLRILTGMLLPLPLLVGMFFIVGDAFHFNRDAEYLRLSEAFEAGYLFLDLFFYCMMASTYLSIPLVAFSLVLEFTCKRSASRYLAGIIFGVSIGALLAFAVTSAFTLLTSWDVTEACVHMIGTVAVMLFCVMVVDRLRSKKIPSVLSPPQSTP